LDFAADVEGGTAGDKNCQLQSATCKSQDFAFFVKMVHRFPLPNQTYALFLKKINTPRAGCLFIRICG
jgi:hypothetical protein